jgi:murein DD-endopeptidase MepM/ murein hydrolase activator NlpD
MLAWAPSAAAEEASAVLYRLPYQEGQAYMISQARRGFITTHTTPDSRDAVDFKMPEGTPVVAARDGVVIAAEWHYQAGAGRPALSGKGNLVRVRHADGTVATYAHLMYFGVSIEDGEIVAAGKLLGYSGSTGYASGPHLHFAVTRAAPSVRAGDALQEVSVPVMFYNGNPPVAFAPRVGLAVTASYLLPAEPLAAPRATPRRVEAARTVPPPEVIAGGMVRLVVACLLALAGVIWFYRFSQS